MKTLGEIPLKHAQLHSDRTALIDGSRRITFAQLEERTARLAGGLLSMGLRPGDRVAVLMANSLEYAELPFAVSRAGLVLVNVNERLTSREISFILRDCGARAVITAPAFIPLLESASQDTSGLKFRISTRVADGFLSYDDLIRSSPTALQGVEVREDVPAILIYTSGTTGMPKGVQLTHRNILHSATNFLLEAYHEDDGVYIACMPYHHVACVPHLAALLKGWTVITTTFDPDRVMGLIQEHRATTIFLVPTMIQIILNHPGLERFDLSSLKTIFYAAAPIPVAVLKRALARFGAVFVQMYGLTETSSLCTMLRKSDHLIDSTSPHAKRLASCGREVTHVSVRVVDKDGTEVPADEIGEVVIRGDNVLEAYWQNAEATKEALRDGWLYTGDLGYMSSDRYLYIVDRKKDLIISGGVNIYPREVEEILYLHPAIREACVIGIPDEKWGEAVHAVIAFHSGGVVTDQELVSHCQTRLASFKKPRGFSVVDALPKNAAGKIDKKAVRAPYWANRESSIV